MYDHSVRASDLSAFHRAAVHSQGEFEGKIGRQQRSHAVKISGAHPCKKCVRSYAIVAPSSGSSSISTGAGKSGQIRSVCTSLNDPQRHRITIAPRLLANPGGEERRVNVRDLDSRLTTPSYYGSRTTQWGEIRTLSVSRIVGSYAPAVTTPELSSPPLKYAPRDKEYGRHEVHKPDPCVALRSLRGYRLSRVVSTGGGRLPLIECVEGVRWRRKYARRATGPGTRRRSQDGRERGSDKDKQPIFKASHPQPTMKMHQQRFSYSSIIDVATPLTPARSHLTTPPYHHPRLNLRAVNEQKHGGEAWARELGVGELQSMLHALEERKVRDGRAVRVNEGGGGKRRRSRSSLSSREDDGENGSTGKA
ncbi:hypothetical protein R3P38DRAFT_3381115 [Favolaschia claudopus]|uniref:Uncharacterized protein n=1 Tax=Favolaschia claudopus TaxID=2862362 RepID=A0AAV9YZN7_9AGAR